MAKKEKVKKQKASKTKLSPEKLKAIKEAEKKSASAGISNMLKGAFAPSLLFIFLFGFNFLLLSPIHSVIAIYVTLCYMKLRKERFIVSNTIKMYLVFMITTCLAFLACLNPVLCGIVNLLGTFFLMYFFLDEFNPANQIPICMCFILYQMQPAYGLDFLIRLGSVTIGMAICFIFVIVTRIVEPQHQNDDIRPIIALALQCYQDKQQVTLCESKLAAILYENNELVFSEKSEITRYFPFLTVIHSLRTLEPNAKLTELFNKVAKAIVEDNVSEDLVKEVGNFALRNEGVGTSEYAHNKIVNATGFLATCLSSLAEEHKSKRSSIENYLTTLKFRITENLNLHSFKTRFAIRLAIIVTPCCLFASITNFPHAYWLASAVFVVLLPYREEALKKMIQRTVGTLIGTLVTFLFTLLCPFEIGYFFFMIAATYCIFCTKQYHFTSIFITCSALSVNMMIEGVEGYNLFLFRIMYTLIGVLLSLFANYLILPAGKNSVKREREYKLLVMNKQLIENLQNLVDLYLRQDKLLSEIPSFDKSGQYIILALNFREQESVQITPQQQKFMNTGSMNFVGAIENLLLAAMTLHTLTNYLSLITENNEKHIMHQLNMLIHSMEKRYELETKKFKHVAKYRAPMDPVLSREELMQAGVPEVLATKLHEIEKAYTLTFFTKK